MKRRKGAQSIGSRNHVNRYEPGHSHTPRVKATIVTPPMMLGMRYGLRARMRAADWR